ncbi:phage major capsid protein [Roseomonas rosulenta]|uniref:phage major capsid protein n=1 Tax=Roseomonas rosulenta TaxID=2748667 RepID=UPI0018DFA128|nr:phage major capsid protein [Roseomonas rosulenta]
MDTDVKEALDGLGRAFEEFKATNDSRLDELARKGSADVLLEEKLQRVNTALDQFETLNQRLTKAELEAKAGRDAAEGSKEALERIETRLNRPGMGSGDRQAELKARVNTWARAVINAHTLGVPNLTAEQQKALSDVAAEHKAMSIADDTTGGYLAPSEYVREIIKGVTEMSPVRSLARVRGTSTKSIMLPKRTGQFAARRVSEQGTRTETPGLAYGMIEITAPEVYALVDISQHNLEDSAYDLESEIRAEAVEQFAVKEGQEFVGGSGVGEAEGILTNADIAFTVSGSAATIADAEGQGNGLITLFHALRTAYARNAVWTLNRVTLGSVRKLKDADKNYVWMPGLANGVPNTILGAQYVECPDMPNEGADAFPIAFGDFRRGYVIVDRIAMTMLRDPFTQATSGNVRFLFRRRMGGAVVLAETMRKLKCAAA